MQAIVDLKKKIKDLYELYFLNPGYGFIHSLSRETLLLSCGQVFYLKIILFHFKWVRYIMARNPRRRLQTGSERKKKIPMSLTDF